MHTNAAGRLGAQNGGVLSGWACIFRKGWGEVSHWGGREMLCNWREGNQLSQRVGKWICSGNTSLPARIECSFEACDYQFKVEALNEIKSRESRWKPMVAVGMERSRQIRDRVWMHPNQDLLAGQMWPGEDEIKNNSLLNGWAVVPLTGMGVGRDHELY